MINTARDDVADIRSALSCIPATDRETWVQMGMAVKSKLGDTGFGIWDEWSSTAHNYSEKAARSVWRSIKAGSIGIGTLFYIAKQHGWRSGMQAPHPMPTKKPPAPQKFDTSKYVRKIWPIANLSDAIVAAHPYSRNQDVTWAGGARRGGASGRVIGQNADCIIVPIRDLRTWEVMAVQAINTDGAKQTFGPLKGHGFVCGNTLDGSIPWFIVEGWADAVSTFQTFNGNVCVFASCGLSVMDALAERVIEIYAPDDLKLVEDAK
ncbi:hypothetical protein DJ030_03370 [bacterium endosymbiont of Escarpia laminata]|nr:MAG: hypothetical protein DJ030_03370 [bacterium endosymbiont of Escarpia laminata]